jgi:hypothetical protein
VQALGASQGVPRDGKKNGLVRRRGRPEKTEVHLQGDGSTFSHIDATTTAGRQGCLVNASVGAELLASITG